MRNLKEESIAPNEAAGAVLLQKSISAALDQFALDQLSLPAIDAISS